MVAELVSLGLHQDYPSSESLGQFSLENGERYGHLSHMRVQLSQERAVSSPSEVASEG